MAGIIKSHVQLGDSVTATQNFMLTAQAADGTMKLARGNNGATTQDIITVATDGNVQLTKTSSQSMVHLVTSNGYGSTNTMIRRFVTSVANQGSDITYSDSATLGASFSINTNGVYSFGYIDSFNTLGAQIGISKNSTQLTTAISSCSLQDIISYNQLYAANSGVSCTGICYLAAGSIIRPHTSGNVTGAQLGSFMITRVA